MKAREARIAGAVLAGGRNSRMSGFNKAFILLNSAPVIQKTLGIFGKIFDETIIVTNSPQDFKLYEKDAVIAADIIKDIGPLGGIHAALSATSKEAVFFAACDMPFLHNGLIRRQLSFFNRVNCDCVVPRLDSLIEPLHAIYKKSLRDNISNFVKNRGDYSIGGFLKTVNAYYWDLEKSPFNEKIFKNLNTKDDLVEVKARLPYEDKIKSLA